MQPWIAPRMRRMNYGCCEFCAAMPASREQRIELLQSIQSHRFSDPEYQVVFSPSGF